MPSSTAQPYARVHSGRLCESQSAPGGRQLVGISIDIIV